MSSQRFHIRTIQAGDAARVAEQSPKASSMRIEGGTAARMAEDAKRVAESDPVSTGGWGPGAHGGPVGFSIRATSGQVGRPERIFKSRAEVEQLSAASKEAAPVVAAPPLSASQSLPSSQSEQLTLGAQVHAMFRKLQARVIPSRLPEE